MSFLHAIPMSRKLPAIIVILCLAASVSIAVVSYREFQRNIASQVKSSFQVIATNRGTALTQWFERVGDDVLSYATDPTVIAATTAFNSSYGLMIDPAGLQAAYITNNANPVGEKDLLDQAPEAVPYNFQHGSYHPYFRQIKDAKGYYDFFLLNTDGDLMYSVFKEADYATNFVSGPYRDSGLAQAFAAALDGAPGAVYFADMAPYAPSAGAPATFLSSPIQNSSGETIGVVAVQLPINQIAAVMHNPNGLGETGEIYVVGPDRLARSPSRFDTGFDVLQDLSGLTQIEAALTQPQTFLPEVMGVSGEPVLAKVSHIDVFGTKWGIIAEIAQTEAAGPAIAVRNKMAVLTAVVGIVSILLGWLTARSVVRPLARVGDAMQQVAERDYDVDLQEQRRGDEIGGLSRALLDFRDKLQASDAAEEERSQRQAEQARVVSRLSSALSDLANGDLTHRIKTAFESEYEELRENFNRTVDNLNETIGSVVGRSQGIRQRSDKMSNASDDLSRRTENQAATLEQTAAALDELTTSVKSAADGAREVEGVVENARHDAEESEPVVRNAVQAMTAIETSANEISQIIGVIDDIAFQTNLLALNAGVEAARAGEAGRGFAVVASEVRALAQRSSDAAKQIKGLISASSGQVEEGVALVDEAGAVLTKIAGHINHISGLIGDIAAGAEEQSTGLGEINIGVTQLDKVTQQNAAMVEEATANSHALNDDAGELARLMERFNLGQAPLGATSHGAVVPMSAPSGRGAADPRATPQMADAPPPKAVANGAAGGDIWQDF